MTPSIIFFGVLSAAVGFLCAKYIAGEEVGAEAKIVKNRVRIKNHVVHVHHWLYGSFFLIGLHSFFATHPSSYEEIIYGFMIGVVIQGLTYPDFYRIVYKEEESESLLF
jgi:hypothetical protein